MGHMLLSPATVCADKGARSPHPDLWHTRMPSELSSSITLQGLAICVKGFAIICGMLSSCLTSTSRDYGRSNFPHQSGGTYFHQSEGTSGCTLTYNCGSFARLEEQTQDKLLQDIQVSLGSMQVRSDETRTQLEGLHRQLRRLTYQARGQYPPGVFDLEDL